MSQKSAEIESINKRDIKFNPKCLLLTMSVSVLYLIILALSRSEYTNHGNKASDSLNVISIPPCLRSKVTLKDFKLSDGSTSPEFDTAVSLCYQTASLFDLRPLSLLIEFTMRDNSASSPFMKCNDPIYESNAVEFFIAPYVIGMDAPTSYLEVEINPNGALFVGTINNECDHCRCIDAKLIPCDASGILDYQSAVDYQPLAGDGKYIWKSHVEITMDFIREMSGMSAITGNVIDDVYRLNFYRIDDQGDDSHDTEYSCWNPTMATPPCFHVPSSFGYFELSD